VALYGGAVFTVVYGSRDSTKDVDAIVRPSEPARRLALQVAHEQDLPEDGSTTMCAVSRRLGGETPTRFGEFGRASRVGADYSLPAGMKVNACRAPLPGYAGDQEDILFLVRKMELKTFAK